MMNILNKFFIASLLVVTIGVAHGAVAVKADPVLVNEYIEKLKGKT